jgi:hypothetical protein
VIATVLSAMDPAAAEPAVAFMRRTPAPWERRLPLLTRTQLDAVLPAATLAVVDALLDGSADAPPAGAIAEDGLAPVRPAWFSPQTHAAWTRVAAAMRADLGAAPAVASGYRSPASQALLILWLWEQLDRDAAAVAARAEAPAASEHCRPVDHAVDLTTAQLNGGDPAAFAGTDAYAWLREHAAGHGFHETFAGPDRPEPWHWRHRV